MKKILIIIILNLCFIISSKADDIKDFQIGNFSLNESLLDNFTKKELISNWEYQKSTYTFTNNKYYKIVFLTKNINHMTK